MNNIKAGTGGLGPDALVQHTKHVETSMTGNASFPTPTPTVAAVTAQRLALETAIQNALPGAHAEIALRNEAARILRGLLTLLAQYVNSASNGDLAVALSSGFPEVRRRAPIGPLPAPIDFRNVLTDYEGRVSLRWKGVRGSKLYHVYQQAAGGSWELVGVTGKPRFNVDSLTPGTIYTFSVTAIGAAGESAYSDVARAMAA